ncbi:unnamed protein product, partial [Amoebophrya sp. A120]
VSTCKTSRTSTRPKFLGFISSYSVSDNELEKLFGCTAQINHACTSFVLKSISISAGAAAPKGNSFFPVVVPGFFKLTVLL